MDVKTAEMNGALDSVYSTAIDNGEVNNLLNEMKDQVQMNVNSDIQTGTDVIKPVPAATNDMDAMQAKLNDLKNLWTIIVWVWYAKLIFETFILQFNLKLKSLSYETIANRNSHRLAFSQSKSGYNSNFPMPNLVGVAALLSE